MKTIAITLGFLGITFLSASGCAHKSLKSEASSLETPTKASVDPSLEMTHFAFDSDVLTEYGKEVLAKDAEQLRQNPALKIEVQGFCDDRGSVAYNLKLGERRAKAVKNYLAQLGISKNRIATVSFGKDRPLDPRDNEEAWAKNRRASFVILDQSKNVASR